MQAVHNNKKIMKTMNEVMKMNTTGGMHHRFLAVHRIVGVAIMTVSLSSFAYLFYTCKQLPNEDISTCDSNCTGNCETYVYALPCGQCVEDNWGSCNGTVTNTVRTTIYSTCIPNTGGGCGCGRTGPSTTAKVTCGCIP